MNKKQKPADALPAASFEHHLNQLESIVRQLETGQMDLSESLKVFEAGLQHLRYCHQRLHEAEERIAVVVNVDADGTARLKDFASSESPPKESTRGNSAKKPPSDPTADRLF